MQGGRSLDIICITGGRPLAGTLAVQGSKNAVLPILAATAAIPGRFTLTNCPAIRDVAVTRSLLEGLGMRSEGADGVLRVDSRGCLQAKPDPALARLLRSSVLLLGALLARLGEAEIPLPGGCVLGERPLDLHAKALEDLGVRVCRTDGVLRCRGRPKSGIVILPYPSVGATENVMLASLGASGAVRLIGAAREPEIVDLADFLTACGARITGAGTPCILIEPAPLHGTSHRILPDRIEAATWLCAAAATGGTLALTALRPEQLRPVLAVLRQAGCEINETASELRLRAAPLHAPGAIVTGPYPAFPTDAQAVVMAALLRASGSTLFRETVFSDRFRHVPALRAMGAEIETVGELACVRGVPGLHGAEVCATDLRGAAAMVVAALAAEGRSIIHDAWHLDRGYCDFTERLRRLGAEVDE